ncbi:MAG: carboxypeptidase regulatory-like domain-containing protein, partial [Candidatus Cloacimonadaceae bacterium]
MKKQILFVLLILAVSFGFAATYQIGDGTEEQRYVPCYGWYNYSSSKSIYTAAEIAAAGLNSPDGLIGIGYDVSSWPEDYYLDDQFIYMRHTNLTQYTDSSMISSEGFTLVYSGEVLFDGNGWHYIYFDEPFPYDGESGIEILWENRFGTYQGGYPYFRSTPKDRAAAYQYDDHDFPEAPSYGNGSNSRPNIVLVSPQTTPPNALNRFMPADNGLIFSDSVELRWADSGGFPIGYKLYAGTTNPPPFVADLGDWTYYELADLEENTTYYWKVEPYNEIGTQTDVPIWSFESNPTGLVVIGDGNDSQRFPMGVEFGYERSVAVYTFAEAGSAGMIERIGWEVAFTGSADIPYKIYLGTTADTQLMPQTFDSLIRNMDLVHEGNYMFDSHGWHTFTLDEPYPLIGGNLIVAVETNYGGYGYGSDAHFYCTDAERAHIVWMEDGAPPTENGYVEFYRPNLLLSMQEISEEPELFLRPDSNYEFPITKIGTTAQKEFMIANIGSGEIDITGISISGDDFVLAESFSAMSIGSVEMYEFTVEYSPTEIGEHSATILIETSEGNHSIELSGSCYDPTIREFPYTENFDGEWTGSPAAPFGWSVVNADNDGYTWRQDNQSISPTPSAPYAAFGAGNKDDYLITPPILVSDNDIRLKWWDRVQNQYYASRYKILISTTDAEITSFTEELLDVNCTNTDWTEKYVNIDAATYSGTIFVAFYQYDSIYSHLGFGIDDFSIEELSHTPAFAAEPESHDFGETFLYASGRKNIQIGNIGGSTLTINTVNISGNGAFEIEELPELPVTLGREEYIHFDAVFAPLETGEFDATITITDDLGTNTIVLTGSCIDATISEFPFFEGFEEGNTHGSTDISNWGQIIGPGSNLWTANNDDTAGSGRAPLSGEWNVYLYRGDNVLYRPIMLEEGSIYRVELYGRQDSQYTADATIGVSFGSEPTIAGMDNIIIRETGITYGNYRYLMDEFVAPSSGVFFLGIHGKLRSSAYYLSLDNISITQISNDPVFTISADDHDFGEVKLSNFKRETFTIKNEGAGELVISSIEIDGDAFSLDNLPTFPIALGYEDTTTFDAIFSPEEVGEHSATITIADNVDTRTVTLTGTGFDPTICEFPFFEGFEDGYTNNTAIAERWTQITGPAYTGRQWNANKTRTSYNCSPRSGDWNATLQYSGQSTLIRPIALEGGKSYMLEMYARQDGASSANATIKVSYASDIAHFDLADTIIAETGIVNGDYQQLKGYLQPEEDGIYYLGITGWINVTPNYLSIDDIEILEISESPVLVYSPESIDFDLVAYGKPIGPINVMIQNDGLYSLELDASYIDIVGPHADMFSFDEEAFPISVELGEDAYIPVYVTGTVEGEISAALIINYADEEYEVELSANVLPYGSVIIGDGTVNTNMPINPRYAYSYSQTIYLAEDIMTENKRLDKIAYHWNGADAAPNSGEWTVYVGHTHKTFFGMYFDNWFNMNELTQVYQGHVDLPAEDMWIELILQTPFWYNGVDNLAIAVVETGTDNDSSNCYFYGTSANNRRSLFYQSDTYVPNPASPSAGSTKNAYPNIIMHFSDIPEDPVLFSSTESIDFGTIIYGTSTSFSYVEVVNHGRGNLVLYEEDVEIVGDHAELFKCYNNVFPTSIPLGESALIPVYVSGMAEGAAQATLIINYADEEHEVELSVNVLPEGVIPIGDGTEDRWMPVAPAYDYSYSQTLYMPDEIMTGGQQIEKLAYQWNGAAAALRSNVWTIYMGHTDKDEFEGDLDWIDTEDLTEVYHGEVGIHAIEGWIEIELDNTFEYNGYENLVIAVRENKPGNDGSYMYFYNTLDMMGRSIYCTTNNDPIDLNWLPQGELVNAFPNIKITFEIPFDVPTLQYRPTSIDFGEYTFGDISQDMALKIRNAGMGTLVLNETDVSLIGDHSNMFDFDASVFPISLEYAETANIFLRFAASSPGDAEAEFVINYDGEEHTVELVASVFPEGIVHLGDPVTDNLNYIYSFPAPYGNHAERFREQYLIRQEEMGEIDSEATYINSVAFNVHSVEYDSCMPNYRIRIKETQQEELENSFEAGEYTLVYQADEYYPELGWNVHTFNQPFYWDGESNLLIEIEIGELIPSGSTNAKVYNTNMGFNSSIRYEVMGTIARNPILVKMERPNMLLGFQEESIGALSGIVFEDGRVLPRVEVSIVGTDLVTLTDEEGQYHFPLVPAGSYTVVAEKYGYDAVSHQVRVIGDDTAEQHFSLVGYPEYAIDFNEWDFGVVYVGDSNSKEVNIMNLAGGELVITSITIEGSDAFSLDHVLDFPHSIFNEESSPIEIVFTPYDSGEVEATVVITDNLNRSYRVGIGRSPERAMELSPYEILLSGEGKFMVELGHQQLVSEPNTLPNPYSLDIYSFREQYLILAEELMSMGMFPGYIDNLSFNVAALNDIWMMSNYYIHFKHTDQNDLGDALEGGDYEQVYFAEGYELDVGWNTHEFETPFLWDGYSNILVEIFSDDHYPYPINASVYYSDTSFNGTLRSLPPPRRAQYEMPGISVAKRANMKLGMRASNIIDLVAAGLTGPIDPVVDREVIYSTGVRNISREEITEYTVLLLDEDENILASVAGEPLLPLQMRNVRLPWTPDIVGAKKVFARIVMADDENLDNNDSPILNVAVFDEGLEITQIGSGTQQNLPAEWPTPYASAASTFREQYLYTMEDLYEMGAAPGEISAISFDVLSVAGVAPQENYRIRVKTTEQETLNSTFEAGDYTQVYHSESFMPAVGINMHYFGEPFIWNGLDNLLVDIVVDRNYAGYGNAIVNHTETTYNSSLGYQGNISSGVDASTGTAINKRPNTILHIISEKLGSVAGVVMAVGEPLEGVEIKLEGTQWQTITDANGYFRFPWLPVGSYTLSGSKQGYTEYSTSIDIAHKEKLVLEIDMPALATAFVSGRVLGSDRPDGLAGATITLEGPQSYSDQSDIDGTFRIEVFADEEYELYVNAAGYVSYEDVIEVGLEDSELGNIVLNEIAYSASDLTAEINPRYDGVILDWNAPIPGGRELAFNAIDSKGSLGLESLLDTESRSHIGYDIWRLASSDEENPSNWELITLEPLSDIGFVDNDWLDLPDGNYLWALKTVYDADIVSDPIFSNELIKSNTYGLLAGFILDDETQQPIADAQISIDGEPATESRADGSYSIEVAPGPHVVSVSHIYFHDTDAEEFVIWPSETTNLNIEMQSLPKVEVSGTILASDTGEGFERVTLSFLGFMDYEVQTEEDGSFALDVYAGKNYSYTIMKDGYESIEGSISVADIDYDMGEITLYEIAYMPSDLEATINDTYTAVELSWNAPQVRGLEGYQIWRTQPEEDSTRSQYWEWLAFIDHDQTSYTDEDWQYLYSGVYNWIVKAQYSADLMSDPIYSNELYKSNAGGQLGGFILDEEDESPVFGAVITVDDEHTIISRENGSYSLNLAPGPHTISVSHRYYEDSGEIDFVILPGEIVELNIELESLPKAMVSGRVLASDTGEGLAGVDITITGFMDYNLETDADGSFSVLAYAGYTYDFELSKTGYDSYSATIEVGHTALNLGEITLYETAYMPSGLVATINDTYTAVELSWNAPQVRGLEGYQIWRTEAEDRGQRAQYWDSVAFVEHDQTSYTDESWLDLANGDYYWIVKAQYTADVISDPIYSNELYKSNADGLLAGFILDDETQQPIADAQIRIDGELATASAADGSYSMEVSPGLHAVSVAHTYFHETDAEEFAIWPSETTDLNIEMQSLPRVEVSGTILASDTGEGLEGATLRFLGFMDYEIQSAADGGFALEMYADKDYSYTIVKEGYDSIEGNISVADIALDMGEITLYEIAYLPSDLVATINDTYTAVELSWNAPQIRGLEGYQLWRMKDTDRAAEEEWSLLTPQSISDATFEDAIWTDLPDGDYLWAVRAVYTAGVISEPIFSNELYKSNADGLLAGFILDEEDETPIIGATITIDGELTTISDDLGAYNISLAPGPHSISVSHTYYEESDEADFVILPEETTNLNIELESLPRVMVSGTVLASDTGEGLAGVDITITGFMDYNLETDTDGSFSVLAYAGHTYDFALSKDGYESYSDELEVGQIDLDLGEITLYEIAYLPSDLVATINDTYTAVELSWNAPQTRGLEGYQLWRMKDSDRAAEEEWNLLTPEPISDATFEDAIWTGLPDGDYLWAVRAVYTAGVISEPIFSNELYKSNADGMLSGTILDSETQQLIADVAITIDDELTTTSDETGRYVINLPPGPHALSASHIYYEEYTEQSVVIFPDQATVLDFTMESLPKILVSGIVSGTDTIGGLAGASVTITGFAEYELETDADGGFAVQVFADKQYDYAISKDGYEPAGGIFHAQNTDLDLGHFVLTEIAHMPSDLVATINDTYTAAELSWNAPQVRGLEGYQIWRTEHEQNEPRNHNWDWVAFVDHDQTGYTDESWQDLANGNYYWIVRAQYTADVLSDPIYSNILYKSNADGLLAGFILDEEDESPIIGATITVDGEFTAISDDLGAYDILLSPGPHSLSVSHTYYEDSAELSFVILPHEITNLNIELESLPRVLVSGTVLASDTGAGLAGVDISVTGFMDYNLETDADGSFSVLAYAGYTYDFELSKAGYDSFSGELEVGHTALDLGEITLYETAYMPSDLVADINDSYTAVELSWNAPQVRGLEGYQIWRTLAEEDVQRSQYWEWVDFVDHDQTSYTDESWLDLHSGVYYWIVKAQYSADVMSDPIYSNELYKSNADGLLAGFILDEEDNSPIIGAVITVDGEPAGVSDNAGAYDISLAPGLHTISVAHTYFHTTDAEEFAIWPSDTTSLNIEMQSLPKVLVSGTVLASDTGEGLAGVDISVTGFMDYNLETDTDGSFSVLAYAGYTYDFTLSKAGYDSFSG